MEIKKNENSNGELKNDSNEEMDKKETENINEEEEDTKENDDEESELSSVSSKKRRKRITYITFDESYDYNINYFYQELTSDELKEITTFIENFLYKNSTDKNELSDFFNKYPKIKKGNAEKIKKIINDSSEKFPNLSSYKVINDFIISEYFCPKPTICECYFFPDGANEHKVVNMLRTCKKSLDIAIYTFTLESITKAILEVHKRGIPVRIICDNECEKTSTSKIKQLASEGIVCKTDHSSYYMHHKFAVIDNSVVITGSFNWSSQAVNHNEENILFYENKDIAQKYTDEFNRLWKEFYTTIDKEEAIKYIEEKERIKKEKLEKKLKKERDRIAKKEERQKEKEKKEIEKILKEKEKNLQKEKILKEKEIGNILKQKERESHKIKKQMEKERLAEEKERSEIEKLKEKENQKTEKKPSKRGKKETNGEEIKSKTRKGNKKKENVTNNNIEE